MEPLIEPYSGMSEAIVPPGFAEFHATYWITRDGLPTTTPYGVRFFAKLDATPEELRKAADAAYAEARKVVK